jgi:hypothetical protein
VLFVRDSSIPSQNVFDGIHNGLDAPVTSKGW